MSYFLYPTPPLTSGVLMMIGDTMAKYPDPTTQRIWARSDRYTHGGNSRKYLVVHNTANTASAKNEALNLKNNYAESSFHYVIDDVDIIQCVHDYDTAWAVGPWKGATAIIRNNQSISIEVCSNGTEFTSKEVENLRKLVLHLMEYYGIPADHVVRHYDCHTGHKACPAAYCGSAANDARWAKLHDYVTGKTSSYGGSSSSGSTTTRKPPSDRLDPGETILLYDNYFGHVCAKYWQARLRKAGYYPKGKYNIDGDFGYYTKLETQKFLQQRTNHYPKGKYKLDGSFGPYSVKALQSYLIDVKCYWDEGGWCIVDGNWGNLTTLAVQRAVNAGVLFGNFDLRL